MDNGTCQATDLGLLQAAISITFALMALSKLAEQGADSSAYSNEVDFKPDKVYNIASLKGALYV